MLAERIESNILATVLDHIAAGRYAATTSVFAYGIDDDGQARFGALRTPPWFLLASELDPAAAPDLMRQWLDVDPDVPGVSGLPETATGIAAAWSAHTNGSTRCRMREGIHVLDQVQEPARPAPGELRAPHDHERDLLVDWVRAFTIEIGTLPVNQAESMVDAQLARGGISIWEHQGPVSMLAVSPNVSGVVRIGPVYTPPEHRQRGYATSMVAAVSRRELAGGADRCMLYTDLANPTSNKIYAEVGYRRVGDWEEHEFEAARR